MRSVSNNIRNLRRFGFKWDFQAILIYISRRVTWLSFFLSVSASRFFLAENSRGKEDGGERIYIPGELFYSICNSNRLAASVEEECKCLCVRSRASEREREREGNRRKTNRGGSTFGGWKRNLREVSIADIRANWFSFLRFLLQGPLLISASPRLFPHSFLLFLFFYLFPIVYVTLELRKTNQASLKRCSNKNDTF